MPCKVCGQTMEKGKECWLCAQTALAEKQLKELNERTALHLGLREKLMSQVLDSGRGNKLEVGDER